jgi:hypothetical protein
MSQRKQSEKIRTCTYDGILDKWDVLLGLEERFPQEKVTYQGGNGSGDVRVALDT